MKILISAESTIDMPQELLDKYGIKTLPYGIFLGEELVEDRLGISEEIYKYVNDNFDFSVSNIINELELLNPIYYDIEESDIFATGLTYMKIAEAIIAIIPNRELIIILT